MVVKHICNNLWLASPRGWTYTCIILDPFREDDSGSDLLIYTNIYFDILLILNPNKMSPIPRNLVKFTQRIRNPALRNLTLSLIEEATQKPDLAHFTIATLK